MEEQVCGGQPYLSDLVSASELRRIINSSDLIPLSSFPAKGTIRPLLCRWLWILSAWHPSALLAGPQSLWPPALGSPPTLLLAHFAIPFGSTIPYSTAVSQEVPTLLHDCYCTLSQPCCLTVALM